MSEHTSEQADTDVLRAPGWQVEPVVEKHVAWIAVVNTIEMGGVSQARSSSE